MSERAREYLSAGRMEKTTHMRINDFASPENMIRWTVKLFVGILALLLLPALLQLLLRALPGLGMLVGLLMASLVAYAVREAGRPRSRRTGQTGGAERIPVLPADEEEF